MPRDDPGRTRLANRAPTSALWEFTLLKLPLLPYAYDALEPVISARAVQHHDELHAGYVRAAKRLAASAGVAGWTLDEIVAAGASKLTRDLYINSAQAWNHAFYWRSMTPMAGPPSAALMRRIERHFGYHSLLRAEFIIAGKQYFGSGWLWLVSQRGELRILTTRDADNFLTNRYVKPLLVCDLWEHAYYLDYQTDRAGYLERWFDRLANWRFAEAQLTAMDTPRVGSSTLA